MIEPTGQLMEQRESYISSEMWEDIGTSNVWDSCKHLCLLGPIQTLSSSPPLLPPSRAFTRRRHMWRAAELLSSSSSVAPARHHGLSACYWPAATGGWSLQKILAISKKMLQQLAKCWRNQHF
jgi:hypothetical protein